MTRTIAFLSVALSFLTAVSKVQAQLRQKTPTIGFLGQSRNSNFDSLSVKAFRKTLRELGWLERKNIIVEWRFAKGVEERVPEFIAEFIRLKVDAMVLTGGQPVRLAKKATNTIPIVMIQAINPVENGIIDSVAKPGGNVTGLTPESQKLDGKRIEILKESVPKISEVAILWQASRTNLTAGFEETEYAAKKLGVKIRYLKVNSPAEINAAFKTISAGSNTGLMAVHTQLINSNRTQIIKIATERRIPAIFYERRYALAGGLLSYGPNIPAMFGRSAIFVDKILKGANPADLPVELPTTFELIVNLKTAEEMGIKIPFEFIRWADEVIR